MIILHVNSDEKIKKDMINLKKNYYDHIGRILSVFFFFLMMEGDWALAGGLCN